MQVFLPGFKGSYIYIRGDKHLTYTVLICLCTPSLIGFPDQTFWFFGEEYAPTATLLGLIRQKTTKIMDEEVFHFNWTSFFISYLEQGVRGSAIGSPDHMVSAPPLPVLVGDDVIDTFLYVATDPPTSDTTDPINFSFDLIECNQCTHMYDVCLFSPLSVFPLLHLCPGDNIWL